MLAAAEIESCEEKQFAVMRYGRRSLSSKSQRIPAFWDISLQSGDHNLSKVKNAAQDGEDKREQRGEEMISCHAHHQEQKRNLNVLVDVSWSGRKHLPIRRTDSGRWRSSSGSAREPSGNAPSAPW